MVCIFIETTIILTRFFIQWNYNLLFFEHLLIILTFIYKASSSSSFVCLFTEFLCAHHFSGMKVYDRICVLCWDCSSLFATIGAIFDVFHIVFLAVILLRFFVKYIAHISPTYSSTSRIIHWLFGLFPC